MNKLPDINYALMAQLSYLKDSLSICVEVYLWKENYYYFLQ